jgi:hypothetical protein
MAEVKVTDKAQLDKTWERTQKKTFTGKCILTFIVHLHANLRNTNAEHIRLSHRSLLL